MGTGFFPGVKCGRGVLLTTHPALVPRSRKSRAILYPPSRPHRPVIGITLPLPLLGNYAAYSGNSSPTFRDKLSVPSSRGEISRTLEMVTKFLKETLGVQTLLSGNDNVNRLGKQRKSNSLLCNIHACCQEVKSVDGHKK